MFYDNRTTLADNVTAGSLATGAQYGNTLDIAATGIDGNVDDNVGGLKDIGSGRPVYLNIFATQKFVGASGTDHVGFKLVSSDNPGLTGSVTHLTTADWTFGLGTDTLTGGTNAGKVVFQGPVPSEGAVPYKRYVGLISTIGVVTTSGQITAFLSLDPNAYKLYPQGHVNLP